MLSSRRMTDTATRPSRFSIADLLTLCCGALLLAAFLALPWFAQEDTALTANTLLAQTPLSPLLLIRTAGAAALLAGLWGLVDVRARGISRTGGFLAGLLGLVYYSIVFVQNAQGVVNLGAGTGFGFWLCLVASLLLIGVVFVRRPQAPRYGAIVLPLLILLLAGMLMLFNAARGWTVVLSGPPGTLLYAATFDAPDDAWDLYTGRLEAQIAGGVLRIDSEVPVSGPYSYAQPHFADFDFSIQATAVGGPLNNGFGVIVRLQNQGNRSTADDSYYLFLISSDGYYQVRRVLNGSEKVLSTWIESSVIQTNLGVTNTLRVVARGSQFQFFVNGQAVAFCVPNNPENESTYYLDTCVDGQMLTTLVDDSISSGQLGAVIVTLGEPQAVTVEFDNVVVLGAPQE